MRFRTGLWLRLLLAMLAVLAAMESEAALAVAAQPDQALHAAFIRDGNLWVISGEERQAAAGGDNAYPAWSSDGRWVAYTKGSLPARELWVLNVGTGEQSLVSSAASGRFEWSPAPAASLLAYQTDGSLQYVAAGQPDKPLGAAEAIGNFSWLPDGKGFIAAAETKLQPDGFTPVRIYRMMLEQFGHPEQYTTLHVLPGQSEEFFAVGTSRFKWSADGHWVAFLAEPTASLSADSNTLCVLREDGVVFRTLDHMVRNDSWFKWGPEGASLAYIAGEGRDADTNKRLEVAMIDSGRTALYTPEGFADNDFAWQNSGQIVVSRGKETQGRLMKRRLIAVQLTSGKQKALTKPRGDYAPQPLPERLAWVRRDAGQASVMLGFPNGRDPSVWIANLEPGESYYGQWDNERVLDIYAREA
jgi:Tol biopolymer transport system component